MREVYIKEIDIVLEKIRYIHSLMIALLTGLSWLIYHIANAEINITDIIFISIGIIVLAFLQNNRMKLFELEKELIKQLKENI